MIRPLVCAMFMLIALPFSADARTPNHADQWNGAEINWRDARTGIYEASKTGRPVIMVFHATWCSVCKRFREVFKDPAVVSASRDFVMILVDADAEKEINGAFQPDGSYVPRTLFIDSDGNVSEKLVGSDPPYPHPSRTATGSDRRSRGRAGGPFRLGSRASPHRSRSSRG